MAPPPDPRARPAFRLIFLGLAGVVAGAVWLSSGRDGAATDAGSVNASATAARELDVPEDDLQDTSIAAAGHREPGACAVSFDVDEAHVSEAAVLLAALDPSGRADCRGRAVKAVTSFTKRPVVHLDLLRDFDETADAGGLEAAGLGSSVVARIGLGPATASTCRAEAGFIAVVVLRGRRLTVEAIGPWTAPCAPLEAPTFAAIDGVPTLLEDDGDTSELGDRGWKRVWAFRERTLELAGEVQMDRSAPGASMHGELEIGRGGLAVEETWTPDDGGDAWITQARYRWSDRRLVPRP